MFRTSRILFVALLAIMLVAAATAFATADELAQRKRTAVGKALGHKQGQPEYAALLDSAAGASALAGLKQNPPAEGATLLTLRTGATPEYKTFTLERDGRMCFVIDIFDTINLLPSNISATYDGAPFSRIRTSLFALEPRFVLRVVLDMDSPADLRVRVDGTSLVVECKDFSPAPNILMAAAPEKEARPLASVLSEVDEAIAAIRAQKTAKAPAPRPALIRLPAPVTFAYVKTPLPTPMDRKRGITRLSEELEAVRAAQIEIATVEPILLAAQDDEGAVDAAAEAPETEPAEADDSLPEVAEVLSPEPESQPDVPAEVPETPDTLTQMEELLEDAKSASDEPEVVVAVPGPLEPEDEPDAIVVEMNAEPGPVSVIAPAPPAPEWKYRPEVLKRPMDIDFRGMPLVNVVELMAQMAGVNVVAHEELAAIEVDAQMRDVPLLRALEIILEGKGFGLIHEDNIFHIVTAEEAAAAKRVTRTLFLESAQANAVRDALIDVLGTSDDPTISVTSSEQANVVIIAGPEEAVQELTQLARQLDIDKPTLPTATEAIQLNYADPTEVKKIVATMLTKEIGQVEEDARGRHLIVTDMPVVLEQVKDVIAQLDNPVKQVSIEAMVVDIVLSDASDTGVSWLIDAINARTPWPTQNATSPLPGRVTGGRTQYNNGFGGIEPVRIIDPTTLRSTALPAGTMQHEISGTVDDLTGGTDLLGNLATTAAGSVTFGFISSDFDISGVIRAEVASQNAELLSNPTVVTVENQEAEFDIVQEFPYQEITQTTQGPPVASTEFKDIGTTLQVKPRVTHADEIIAEIGIMQSGLIGQTVTGVPITNTRRASTTLLTRDQETIFIGGLRRVDDTIDVRKVPVLGDMPGLNFLFRNTSIDKVNTELLVFLTCRVLGKQAPALTANQQEQFERLDDVPRVPDSQKDLKRSIFHPEEMRDPMIKWWRRADE